MLICLHSAAKITHKAQALTSHAAKWHGCATVESFSIDTEAASEVITGGDGDSDEEEDSEEDELEDTKIVHPHVHTISFQKRQALG